MTNEPIDLEVARERREEAAIDADQERWEDLHQQLTAILTATELSDQGMTSATLRALLDVLMESSSGIKLSDAKQRVRRCLDAFFETPHRGSKVGGE